MGHQESAEFRRCHKLTLLNSLINILLLERRERNQSFAVRKSAYSQRLMTQ